MRRYSTTCLTLLLTLVCLSAPRAQEVPFRRGVNLTSWFQAGSAREIHFTRYTRQDFEQIKSLGADVIRLPINLHAMTSGAPDYTVDPLLYELLDPAVDWAEALQLHLILDNHTFDPAVDTDPRVGEVLEKVWPQVAAHYKDRSTYLYYEILNEPHGIADALWNDIQQRVVRAIRAVDTTHTLVVGPANWNNYGNLAAMPVYDDDNLIYTFHFYDPFIFTHQGAGWVEPSMGPLAGVPFPYAAGRMPAFPPTLRNSWIEDAFNYYPQVGTVAEVKRLIDQAAQFRDARQVPVFCGEFGVHVFNSPPADRVAWYEVVRTYLEEKDLAWTSWDYHGGFGLFAPGGQDLFDHDLNVPLLRALGLNVPPQTPYQSRPDTTGFMIYSDYLGRGIVQSGYGEGAINYFAAERPGYGRYALSWTGAPLYTAVGFNFQPDKDLSRLAAEGYALDFLVRRTSQAADVDLRFIDTKTADPADHPWRMGFRLDTALAPADRRWHHVRVPLQQFAEGGSWDNNQWHEAEGKFDWTAVDLLEVTTDYGPLGSASIWFDQMQISNQDTTRVPDTVALVTSVRTLAAGPGVKFYPNPVQDRLTLVGHGTQTHAVQLRDPVGRLLLQTSFQRQTEVDLSHLAPGVYVVSVTHADGRRQMQKVVKR